MRFLQPETLPEAVAALAEHGHEAKVIAGGTAVVLMLRQKLIAPAALVHLGRIPDLDRIRAGERGLELGPLTPLAVVARHPLVREHFPALARACAVVGNVRVRNQATIGGNLAEADYASDPPAALLALGASVTAAGPHGERTIPLSDFFLGFFTTALAPGELLTGIHLPLPAPGARSTYLKYRSRSSEDRPCVGVAAAAALDGGRCADLRVAVGAACETPQRLPQVEALARGETRGEGLFAEVAEGYAAGLEPLDDLRGSAWYRREMIRVHVRRALREVFHGGR